MGKDILAANTKDSRGKDMKQQIYSHAIELFIKNGFENVKVSDICTAAKVSVGTFYYYFPSKESILLNFADVSDRLVDIEAREIINLPPEDMLKELFLFKIHTMTNSGPELNNISCVAALKHNCDDSFDSHRSIFSHFMHTIEAGIRNGCFRDDINMYSATAMLRYILAGLVLHWSINSNNIDIDSEAKRLADLFISMLKPSTGS